MSIHDAPEISFYPCTTLVCFPPADFVTLYEYSVTYPPQSPYLRWYTSCTNCLAPTLFSSLSSDLLVLYLMDQSLNNVGWKWSPCTHTARSPLLYNFITLQRRLPNHSVSCSQFTPRVSNETLFHCNNFSWKIERHKPLRDSNQTWLLVQSLWVIFTCHVPL